MDEVTGRAALEELNRREASEVIDELQTVAKEKGIDLSPPKASEKQVGFLKSLKRRAHLTDEEFTALLEEKGGVRELSELGRRDASSLIDELLVGIPNQPRPASAAAPQPQPTAL